MDAEIIAVGTELLLGEILNSDAQFLAQQLSKLGINVFYQTVVGDNERRLSETLTTAISRADIVITSGGLGPTHDDITKETIARVMGIELKLHEESVENMKAYFSQTNRKMSQTNLKQAMMPVDGIVLKNNHGTAPGGIIEKDGKTVIFLPGPPREIVPMFHESVYPYLKARTNQMFYSKTLRIFGLGESVVEELLSELMRSAQNPTVAPYAKSDEVTLRITARCHSEAEGEQMIAPVEQKIRTVLGKNVYGVNDDSLYQIVYTMLKERKLTISFAESLTGGMLSERLTALPGASDVFSQGLVTYSDEAKHQLLDVPLEVLQSEGAVSAQTARYMARGLRKKSGADIAVSVTGIAGPASDSFDHPIGLVYIGVSAADYEDVAELHLAGDRERIRNRTCLHAYDLVRRYLSEERENS